MAALLVLVERGGLIAWITLLLGVALLLKIWRAPSRLDLSAGVALLVVPVLVWIGAWYYVISTWESGEVVELAIPVDKGTHTARLWVMDMDPHPTVYYDAQPEVAQALLAGTPVKVTRAGTTTTGIPRAIRADALAGAEAERVLQAMMRKYGVRMSAANVYYLLLGRSRDRIAVVASLIADELDD